MVLVALFPSIRVSEPAAGEIVNCGSGIVTVMAAAPVSDPEVPVTLTE